MSILWLISSFVPRPFPAFQCCTLKSVDTLQLPSFYPLQLQDKIIEELVLDELYYDIVRNLPADDIVILMDQDKLLTSGQRDHYKMMKANHQPDVEKSEFLLDCLRKGKPGFLERLCTILRTLPPSSYIADKIQGSIE